MGCILDYLKEDNQIISEESPFNYMDAFVFATFAYLPIGYDIREYTGPVVLCDGIRVKNFCALLQCNEGILSERYKKCEDSLNDYTQLITLLKRNVRYQNIEILSFVYENEYDSQFACYVLDLGQDHYCISFRGTDGTYAGWYENFRLLDVQQNHKNWHPKPL